MDWLRTIPNEGLIHFREALNYSFLVATNHRALMDVLHTNSYDFVKPPGGREFLARGWDMGSSSPKVTLIEHRAKLLLLHSPLKYSGYVSAYVDEDAALFQSAREEIRLHPVPGMQNAESCRVC